jgi:hypothetical protein
MRILHVLDHSIPLQSGYTFRTLSLLTEQRRQGRSPQSSRGICAEKALTWK